MLCRICEVQIQPRKHVLDHADYRAANMNWIIHTRNLSILKDLDHEVRIDHLPDICTFYIWQCGELE